MSTEKPYSLTGTNPDGTPVTVHSGGPIPNITVLPPKNAPYMGTELMQVVHFGRYTEGTEVFQGEKHYIIRNDQAIEIE